MSSAKALPIPKTESEQDRKIAAAVAREEGRLRRFIRRQVRDEGEVEDILQEVFYELVEAYRLMKPVEQAGAWLFRVVRNRIIDRFRRRKPDASLSGPVAGGEEDEALELEDLLPSMTAGPDAVYARALLLEELGEALEELPDEQRCVFLAHEVEGRSFKELAAASGVGVNTLLSRKRYAVLQLRRRLEAIYDEFRKG